MKVFKVKLLLLLLLGLFLVSQPASAATSLTNVSLNIEPKIASSLATWTISFVLPQTTLVGHVLISFGGYQPDLSLATLAVSGLPSGTAQVGKSNPSCVSNCDDVRYIFKDPAEVKSGTKITFTLNKVKNPSQAGATGLNFINVFSSKYPNLTLVATTGEKLVDILPAQNLPDEPLIPATATSENPLTNPTDQKKITDVIINEQFYQPGSKTTKLSTLKDPTKVDDFTLDLINKAMITFQGTVDLSTPEAVNLLSNLADYVTLDHLAISIDQKITDYFKVPIEVTFYELPYVWEPDVLKGDKDVLPKDKIDSFRSFVIDNESRVSFIFKDSGAYRLVPHFELYITDNQQIIKETSLATFSGRISDPKAIIAISLNGQVLPEIKPAIDLQRGEFTFALNLTEGANLIEAQAHSEYGPISKITKIVQYQSTIKTQTQEKPGISPFNIAVIILAVLAIVLIIALRYLVKRK